MHTISVHPPSVLHPPSGLDGHQMGTCKGELVSPALTYTHAHRYVRITYAYGIQYTNDLHKNGCMQ